MGNNANDNMNIKIDSIFGEQARGTGVFIDLSDESKVFDECDIKNQEALQGYAQQLMKEYNTNWAISGFGERRERFFRELDAEQMVEEERFYHLGTDIWMPVDSTVFAPAEGVVVESDYEDGFGNYGGYVVLKHNTAEAFYSFYGHLNPSTLPSLNKVIKKNEKIARLGDMTQNGGYFYHTHLQILTPQGYRDGFVHKGYATDEVFSNIKQFILNPKFFLSPKEN